MMITANKIIINIAYKTGQEKPFTRGPIIRGILLSWDDYGISYSPLLLLVLLNTYTKLCRYAAHNCQPVVCLYAVQKQPRESW